MFSSSTAFLLTNNKGWFAHMHELLLQAGFKETCVFPEDETELAKYRLGPLPFIFIHASVGQNEVRRAFSLVRTHADVCIRFLPIIVLTDTRDAATIVRFINLGCDDIVTVPLTASVLIDRLGHQIGPPRDYFQTETYFGPDRRRHEAPGSNTYEARGRGERFFRHFSIQRHLQHGVSIVKMDVYYPAAEPERKSA